MEDLAGAPMLLRVVNRVRRSRFVTEVLVAASTRPCDNVIADCCREHGLKLFRGSEEDVLDRYYQAALRVRADVIVRITSDCPLIDPGMVDRLVGYFEPGGAHVDYASNVFPLRTFPRGLDAEAFRLNALHRAWREAHDPVSREHVTLYILQNPELFSLRGMTSETDYSHMRWTVDEAADLAFVRRIYNHFGHDRFSWSEVVSVLGDHPQWLEINGHVQQKTL